MLLSDIELRAEVDAGRLVFDPPLPAFAFQSASIDLSLHGVFWHPRVPTGPGLEFTVDVGAAQAYDYFEQRESNEVTLAPGEFVLGETAEGISLPRHLAGLVEGKSGRARHGLIVHCTAPHIAPGWGSDSPKRITLELANLGPAPLKLRAGIGIAQLLVLRLGSPSLVQYAGRHLALGSS
jgi:dCTP deaminase